MSMENETGRSSVKTTSNAKGEIQIEIKTYAESNMASDVELAAVINQETRRSLIHKILADNGKVAGG